MWFKDYSSTFSQLTKLLIVLMRRRLQYWYINRPSCLNIQFVQRRPFAEIWGEIEGWVITWHNETFPNCRLHTLNPILISCERALQWLTITQNCLSVIRLSRGKKVRQSFWVCWFGCVFVVCTPSSLFPFLGYYYIAAKPRRSISPGLNLLVAE